MEETRVRKSLEEALIKTSFLYNHIKYIDKDEKLLGEVKATMHMLEGELKELPNIVDQNHCLLEMGDFADTTKRIVEEAVPDLRIFRNYDDRSLFIQDINFYINDVKNDAEASTWINVLKWLKDDTKNKTILEAILGEQDG